MSGSEVFNAAEWLVTRHAREAPDRRAITAVDLDGSARSVTYGELQESVVGGAPPPGGGWQPG